MKLLEICAYDIPSCLVAMRAGAARVEFCANPDAGGTTPAMKDVAYLQGVMTIPVYPIIRPRVGDFCYNETEAIEIKKEILEVKALGCKGISIGAANADKKIDKALMSKIMEWAAPMEVTCHKVFDETPDAFEAMELLISIGVKRILTSGLQKTALEGAELLAELVKQANGRIIIMPGGGVRSANIGEVALITGAAEFHSSACTHLVNGNVTADENEIAALLRQLKHQFT